MKIIQEQSKYKLSFSDPVLIPSQSHINPSQSHLIPYQSHQLSCLSHVMGCNPISCLHMHCKEYYKMDLATIQKPYAAVGHFAGVPSVPLALLSLMPKIISLVSPWRLDPQHQWTACISCHKLAECKLMSAELSMG
jgi:hypothetical protein